MEVLTEKRRQLILTQLQQDKIIQSQDLVDRLSISESTVRRDLASLEADGKLIRVHGGAKLPRDLTPELDLSEKSVKNSQEKAQIACYAASLVQDGARIYLDAGTTSLEMVSHLKGKDILVVTNGVNHGHRLLTLGIETILVGGRAKLNTQAVVGSQAVDQVRNYRFSHVFLGTNSIDAKLGLTTPDSEEAAIKQAAAANGDRVFVLADQSKFDKVSFHKFLDLADCMVITSTLTDELRKDYQDLTTLKEV